MNDTPFRETEANDNLQVVNASVLTLMRNAAKGMYECYQHLAYMYEAGDGVEKNLPKAIKLYRKFYEEHSRRRIKIDEVELLMNIGHLYLQLGNKYRAAEWYLKAGFQIVQDYKDEKERRQMFKKHKVEHHLKKTGCEAIV